MNNNDVLRRLRFALSLSEQQMSAIFALAGVTITPAEISPLMGREDDERTVICLDDLLGAFLDGLIIDRRGPPRDGNAPRQVQAELTNNDIIKKVRIALKLQEKDMLSILREGGQPISKNELSALFRKPGHKHYRVCGNQLLRAFLRGLTQRRRGVR